MKVCTSCGWKKHSTRFYRDKRKKGKFRSECKECFLKKYPYVHSPRKTEIWRKYSVTKKGVITQLLMRARERAKARKIQFDLDRNWLSKKIDTGVCEFTGVKFRYGKQISRANPFGPSIDKIDPKKGYTKKNSRVILFAVNMARSDWGDEVLLEVARAISNK